MTTTLRAPITFALSWILGGAASLVSAQAANPSAGPAPMPNQSIGLEDNPVESPSERREPESVPSTTSAAVVGDPADAPDVLALSGPTGIEPAEGGRLRRRASALTARESERPWYRGEVTALAVVLLLIGAIAWIGRRWLPVCSTVETAALRIVARASLTSKHGVALVQVGRRFILVGFAGEQVSSLTEVTDETEAAELVARCGPSAGAGSRFGRLLGHEAARFSSTEAEQKDLARDSSESTPTAVSELQALRTRLKNHRTRRLTTLAGN